MARTTKSTRQISSNPQVNKKHMGIFLSVCLGAVLYGAEFSSNPDAFAVAPDHPSNRYTDPSYSHRNALLPDHRIVAYYGNFYSKRMGVLGQYPRDEMLSMLKNEVSKWEAADPDVRVIPAIDYIAVVAQKSAGKDGMYRTRMPSSEVQKAITLANEIDGIAILDIQVGLSNVQTEVPALETYLAQPNVMLALDPEFSMKSGNAPGTKIGTLDASDINFAIEYLAKIIDAHDLPPKILVIHRFTKGMITNYKNIKPLPNVQVIIDMDGWGFKAKKINTYQSVIQAEPVQFTGFKLFYINDLKPPSTGLMTPADILKLSPQPLFILYQ